MLNTNEQHLHFTKSFAAFRAPSLKRVMIYFFYISDHWLVAGTIKSKTTLFITTLLYCIY